MRGVSKDDTVKEQTLQYVRLWGADGPLRDELRGQEIRQADTNASIQMPELAFRIAFMYPTTTAFVVFQRTG